MMTTQNIEGTENDICATITIFHCLAPDGEKSHPFPQDPTMIDDVKTALKTKHLRWHIKQGIPVCRITFDGPSLTI